MTPRATAWVAWAAWLALAGCDTVADGRVFESTIKETLERNGTVVTVDCPDRIPLGKVGTNQFRCQVVIVADHRETEIAVVMDAEGNLAWHETTPGANGDPVPKFHPAEEPAIPPAEPAPPRTDDPWK